MADRVNLNHQAFHIFLFLLFLFSSPLFSQPASSDPIVKSWSEISDPFASNPYSVFRRDNQITAIEGLSGVEFVTKQPHAGPMSIQHIKMFLLFLLFILFIFFYLMASIFIESHQIGLPVSEKVKNETEVEINISILKILSFANNPSSETEGLFDEISKICKFLKEKINLEQKKLILFSTYRIFSMRKVPQEAQHGFTRKFKTIYK